jgi:hypothetical protein
MRRTMSWAKFFGVPPGLVWRVSHGATVIARTKYREGGRACPLQAGGSGHGVAILSAAARLSPQPGGHLRPPLLAQTLQLPQEDTMNSASPLGRFYSQKFSFNANCRMRGSRTAVTWPKVEVVVSVVPTVWKLVWLKRLKPSARNCRFMDSLIRVFFKRAMS